MRYTLALCLSFVLLIGSALVLAQPVEHPASAELLANVSAVKPGEPFLLGVRFKLQPHWHVYWLNPGDSGQAPSVQWKLPEGFRIAELQFPIPERFTQPGDIVGYGYEDEVMFITKVTPPTDLKTGETIKIAGDANWLVCKDVCLFGDAGLELDLIVADESKPAQGDVFERWMARLPVAPEQAGATVKVERNWQAQQLVIDVLWSGPAPSNAEWFPPPSESVTFSNIRVENPQKNQTRVTATFSPLARRPLPTEPMQSVLAYDRPGDGHRGLIIEFDFIKTLDPNDKINLPED